MSDRASKLYNDLLKIYGQEDKEYKELISDDSRETLIADDTEAGTTEYAENSFLCLNDSEIGEGDMMLQGDETEMELIIGDFTYKMTNKAGLDKALVGMCTGSGGFPPFTYSEDARDYEDGFDKKLTNPDSQYDTQTNLIFATNSSNGVKVTIGDYEWQNIDAVGEEKVWTGQGAGSAYGQIALEPVSGNWNSFANANFNGVFVFILPGYADGDLLGGYFAGYYESNAMKHAFENNNSKMIIAKNGSVYKDSIINSNLVVRFNGDIGEAGGASAESGGGITGPVRMRVKTNGKWSDFANKSDNGLRNIKLPPLAISEMRIGKTFVVRSVAPYTESQVFLDDFNNTVVTDWNVANLVLVPIASANEFAASLYWSTSSLDGSLYTKTYPATTGPTFQSTLGKQYRIRVNLIISFPIPADNEAELKFKIGNHEKVFNVSNLVTGDLFFNLVSDVDNAPLEMTMEKTEGVASAAIQFDELEILEITCN